MKEHSIYIEGYTQINFNMRCFEMLYLLYLTLFIPINFNMRCFEIKRLARMEEDKER